jgi:hypothetical protein
MFLNNDIDNKIPIILNNWIKNPSKKINIKLPRIDNTTYKKGQYKPLSKINHNHTK